MNNPTMLVPRGSTTANNNSTSSSNHHNSANGGLNLSNHSGHQKKSRTISNPNNRSNNSSNNNNNSSWSNLSRSNPSSPSRNLSSKFSHNAKRISSGSGAREMPRRCASFKTPKIGLNRSGGSSDNLLLKRPTLSNPGTPTGSFRRPKTSLRGLLPPNRNPSFSRDREASPTRTLQEKLCHVLSRPRQAAFCMICLTLLVCSRSFVQVYYNMQHDFMDHMNSMGNLHPAISTSESTTTTTTTSASTTTTTTTTTTTSATTHPKLAYVWLLGGMPSATTTGPALGNPKTPPTTPDNAHMGLLYNVLVSMKILRQTGSRADFVVLVHMASSSVTEELPPAQSAWLATLGATIRYLPPTPSWINEFSTIAVEKFRLLELVQYDRVLYMDADMMPYCNLDYLMELSFLTSTTSTSVKTDSDENNATTILQANVILSIDKTPASSSLFVLQPGVGFFDELLQILASWPQKKYAFDKTYGWGIPMSSLATDGNNQTNWKALNGQSGSSWSFEGADLDQGLLLHWTKYVKGNVTTIRGKEMETWIQNQQQQQVQHFTSHNPLKDYSCLAQMERNGQATSSLGYMWYPDDDLRAKASPKKVAPYRDVAQWRYNTNKPWHYPQAPVAVNSTRHVKSARKYWFHVLRQLDVELQMGLKLNQTIVTDKREIARPEKHNAFGSANWKYVGKKRLKDMNPIWSTKVQALQQWALRLVNLTLISFPWEPPILYEKPTIQNNNNNNNDHAAIASKEGASRRTGALSYSNNNAILDLRSRCTCPEIISTDPCTSTSESLEDWLGRRVPFYLSKQRPLCPNAVKNTMRIVVPIGDDSSAASSSTTSEALLEKTICSMACQDYPPDRISILLYQDGHGNNNNNNNNNLLEGVCGKLDIKTFSPLEADTGFAGTAEFDVASKTLASDTLQEYFSSTSTTESSMLCLRSTQHSGPVGAKYWALRLMESWADANDVIVTVESGDELQTSKALNTINRLYMDNNAWTTYGPTFANNDPLAQSTGPIPEAMSNGTQPFHPRQDQPSWRFGHPRTFKAHLLQHLGQTDFTNADRKWLPSAVLADRSVIYRMLELAGAERVAYTSRRIYKSIQSPRSEDLNGAEDPQEDDPDAAIKHILALESSPTLQLSIHIVLVCWDRNFLLPEQLVWLQQQQIAQTRQLHLHLVNNNPQAQQEIDALVHSFLEKQKSNILNSASSIPMKITVKHNKKNWHAFSRFLYVQELRRKEALDSIIFVDDDQYWTPTFVQSLVERQQPKGMVTWYGKTFNERNPETGLFDYWVSDMRWTDIMNHSRPEITTFTYAGPGGSILDTNLWLLDQQLFRLTTDLQGYYEFDDIWVSYLLDALLGWEIHRLETPLPVDIANCNKTTVQNVLFPLLPPGQPEKLLALYERIGEKLKSVATFTGSSRDVKTKMFEEMQTKFHWNVQRPDTLPLRGSQRPEFVLPSVTRKSRLQNSNNNIKNDNNNLNANKEKRAFVCVTGQFDRFELENKIDFIFKPLQESGYKTDAALVLSSGQALFTNAKKNNLEATQFIPFYTNTSQAIYDLESNNIRVISSSSSSFWGNGTYPRLEHPPLHEKYVELLYKSQKYMRSYEEQMERASNHGRIFDSYVKCLEHADQAALAAGIPGGDATLYYDVFLRIRDDSSLNKPLNAMGVNSNLGVTAVSTVMLDVIPPPPNSIVVTECRNWHGMNDRMAIVAPDIARRYFMRPYEVIATSGFVDERVVKNPETFLLNVYTMSKIHVLGHPDLKRVNRVVRYPGGKVAFYKDDKFQAGCPKAYTYLQRNYELYGWVL